MSTDTGDNAGVAVVSLAEALAMGPPPRGNLAIPVLERGSLDVEFYAPVGEDRQKPHARDEVYAVARGIATFFDGSTRRRVEPGALIFVPAGQEHRFEQFSSDFAVWVLFCDAITPGTRTAGPRRDTSR